MTKLSRYGFVDKRGRQVSLVPVIPSSTSNNFASFKSDGTLQDSGKKATDFAPATHEHSQYLTEHQNISGKADKVANATANNFAALDSNGNLKDSGKKASDFLTAHQDISGKADKVTTATENNFAAFDANGNLKDSGKTASAFAPATHEHSQYLTSHQDISGKVNKVTTATEDHLAAFDASGGIKDSGYVAGSFSSVNHYHSELFQCKRLDINCTDSQTGKILTNPADGSGTDGLKPILIYIDNIRSSYNVSLTNYRIPIIADFKFFPEGTSVVRHAPAILEAMKNGTLGITIHIYFGTGTRLTLQGSLPSASSYWQDTVFESNTYSRLQMIDGVIN